MSFRLPTEAEWEFAARGGTRSQGFIGAGSDNLPNIAWYCDNTDEKPRKVATKAPNELGIYDMSGNVYEWCQDWYGAYNSQSEYNPTGPSVGTLRVRRGGSVESGGGRCRVTCRGKSEPKTRAPVLGFRLAL